MAKIYNVAKDLFNLAKGKALETGEYNEGVGEDSPKGAFNVGTFLGKVQEANGLARANRYLVEIDTPQGAWVQNSGGAGVVQSLQFFCDNVNIPGAAIIPVDHRRNSIGPFDRRAQAIVPSEISASFMLDARGRNLNFFQQWATNIVSMGGPEKAADVTVDFKGAAFGEIAYRSEYITTMRIKTFDMAAQHINTTTMYEVWPSQIGDVTLGWAQNDEIARLTVNFQVRNWVAENHQLPEGQDPSVYANRALSPMEQLLRIGQTGTALKASWKKPSNVGDVINLVSNAQTFLGSFGGRKG